MNKKTKAFIFILITALLLLSACALPTPDTAEPLPHGEASEVSSAESTQGSGDTSDAASTEPAEASETSSPAEDRITAILNRMTLAEKIGQLFIVRPEAVGLPTAEEQTDTDTAFTLTLPVGGVVLFGKNISSPQQITSFNERLQGCADGIPFFVAVDEEGGSVARIANSPAFDVTKYKSAAAVGSSGNADDALSMGRVIGAYLKKYGFNMDFAPVADINTNPDNTVIGDRAFSSGPETAAAAARAMADGLKSEGLIPTFKHFPGHGDTAEDSHRGLAVYRKTEAEAESCEWLPYKSLTDGDCVMVGHIATPEITGDSVPASLSYPLVTGILRQRLGFEGVVITDALEMGAVTQTYSPSEAAVAAVAAGCDILLCPADLTEAFNGILEAVGNGTLSEERINESVYRILSLKAAYLDLH